MGIEASAIAFEQIRHVSGHETAGRQGLREYGLYRAGNGSDVILVRENGPTLRGKPDPGKMAVKFGEGRYFDPGKMEIGVADGRLAGDQAVAGSAFLVRNFADVAVKLLPECGNAGGIVAGEATPYAGDQQRSERDETRGRETDEDRRTLAQRLDQRNVR